MVRWVRKREPISFSCQMHFSEKENIYPKKMFLKRKENINPKKIFLKKRKYKSQGDVSEKKRKYNSKKIFLKENINPKMTELVIKPK